MKALRIGLLAAAVLAFGIAVAGPESTKSLLESAYKTAKAQNKNVFIIFRASWCGWCKRMEQFMDMPKFRKLFDDNYVFVTVTVLESEANKNLENPGGADLMKTLGGDKGGIPFYAIMNSDGKKLIDSNRPVPGKEPANIGHPMAPEEVAHFMKMLRISAKHMKESDFNNIETYLKSQKR